MLIYSFPHIIKKISIFVFNKGGCYYEKTVLFTGCVFGCNFNCLFRAARTGEFIIMGSF